jgi:heptosyltransferase-1
MKILLVKLSSLGDIVHTLPVVQDICAAFPGAQIDWVVEQSFASLLERQPQLHRSIACKIRRWSKSPLAATTRAEWRSFKAELQRERYDAVIDLQGLTKSAVVSWLARLAPGGKRYALANQTDGSGFEAPTRWVADVAIRIKPHIHAVERGRELAAKALNYSFKPEPNFGLRSFNSANAASYADSTPAQPERIAFVHGTSRADKEWPMAHWLALGLRFNAAGMQIVLLHGNAAELATSQAIADCLNSSHLQAGQCPAAVVMPLLALNNLCDELAICAGVIGVDSGVSHIAVALDLPHVQLYNFDTAWRTGPVSFPAAKPSRQLSVYGLPAPEVATVWQAWQSAVQA